MSAQGETTHRPRRITIAAKLGALLGAMTLIAAVVAGLLFAQLRSVTHTYDTLLGAQVHAALQAREMQVAFKKQVQEWKDVLLRGFDPTDRATYTQQLHDRSADVDRLGTALQATLDDGSVRADVQQFLAEHAALNRNYETALTAFVAAGAQDPRVPDRAVRGQDRPPTDRIDGIVAALEGQVEQRTNDQAAAVAGQTTALAVLIGVALVLMVAASALVIGGIVRPIRALTAAGHRAANTDLPEAIRSIRRAEPAAPPPIEVRSRGELHGLAQALNSLQASAVELAQQQHTAERDAAQTLVNLGRRNQGLLKRTLGYISELKSDETDPDVLDRLFRLDHATTRVRRNAESMLVLAGADHIRTRSEPVAMSDVIRAALSEIEDYTRVDLHYLEPAAVSGGPVADVVHLVAELMENAAHFSPPDSRVTVIGQQVGPDYRVRVVDQGIGMTRTELDAANRRIAAAVADGRADSPLLGLYVVGRLAARRGIDVELEPSGGRGITATIVLGAGLLEEAGDRSPDVRTPVRAEPPTRPRRTPPAPSLASLSPAPAEPSAPITVVHPMPVARAGWFDAVPVAAPLASTEAAQAVASAPRSAAAAVAPTAQALTRRVRGAQLPDLGHGSGAGPDFAPPDPEQARRQLSALASGAARAQGDRDARSSAGGFRRLRRRRRPGRAIMNGELSVDAKNVNWLLDRFVHGTDGVERAIGVSSDGLLIAISPPLASSESDRLAAVISGMTSLAVSTSRLLGKGPLRQVIMELDGGFFLVSAIRDGSCLGVVTAPRADLGQIGYETAMLAHRVGSVLTPDLIDELKTSLPR